MMDPGQLDIIDVARLALVTIDVQRDTLDGQPLEVPGTSAILPNVSALCDGFRAAGRPIVHVVRLYVADGSNADLSRLALARGQMPVLRPGTPGRLLARGLTESGDVELNDNLLLAGGIQVLGPHEVVLYKPRWGAFYKTPLDAYLREQDITSLVFAGCNFPNCPRTSIYEASERDYSIIVADDAISGLYDRGRSELAEMGATLARTEPIRRALDSRSAPH